jgi:hypothetical protein
MPDQDLERLTDREWSMRADRHARDAMASVGDLNTRYNDLVQDNRTLLGEIDKLAETVTALEDAVAMLTGLVLND